MCFIIWGAWWAFNVCASYLLRSPRRPYEARAWWPLGVRALRLAEPALKIAVPAFAVAVELLLDHQGHFQ